MTKTEFEQLCSDYMEKDIHISDEYYKIIDYVYMWHPAISDVYGKRQMMHLYCDFDIDFIKNMVPDAETMDQIDKEIRDLQLQIHQLELDRVKILEKWGK